MADYKYVGGKWGGFIVGIPMRDISADDVAKFNIDIDILNQSPLYEKVPTLYKKVTKRNKKNEAQVHPGDVDRA